MRIAILGWARLSLQANEGSGYNLSASELAAGLAMSGHRVFYLRSGMDYVLGRGMYLREPAPWRGVSCTDLVNSPNLSPAAMNFRNMSAEITSPRLTRLVLRWLDRVGSEVVHIHSAEGLSLDLMSAIRASGRPVVVTPHNYWYLCPQVDLLHAERTLCDDYDGGRRCVGCLRARPPRIARLRRACSQTLARIVGHELMHAGRAALGQSRRRLGKIVNGGESTAPRSLTESDPELALGFDVAADRDHDGRIRRNLKLLRREQPTQLGVCPMDQNERFLKAEHHLAVHNEYGRRRSAGIGALNHASLVIPPSEFLRRVHVAMGVDEHRTRHVRLGQPHFDQINRRVRRSPYYETEPWSAADARRPLRFAFFGTTRNNKGLEVFVRAIPLLDPGVRKRAQFLIRAAGWDWPFRKRLADYPEVQFAGAYDLLQLIGATGEYDVGVLCHVWFENSPLVMLEHLHAGKFVVCPRLGGPVDWIHPPENGLLYPAGEPEALAGCITQLVAGEVSIPSPRQIHEASELRSYPDHVREVEQIYRELLAGEAPPAASGADIARPSPGSAVSPV